MSRRTLTALFAAVAALLPAPRLNATAEADPVRILAETDRARGGGLPGVEWTLKLSSVEGSDEDVRELVVQAHGDSSLATTVYPPRMKRAKLLQVERNMWYGRPDLRKPISISPRQRMSGPAVNGDIAATNYYGEYTPTLLREEKVGDEDTWVLDLVGKNKWVTYDRIVYWVSKKRLVAVKAEFYTVSGKLIKTGTFEHKNTILWNNRRTPFVSRIEIRDAINKNNYSTLEYTDVKVRTLTPADFHIGVLGR
ncbi:MAG TPA: outer membrane lipoprotein-sorting protein [Bryobacteraceae bacterium]|nr:outer membrane lipoprotein-sorting protein [Bryobacteraceae bacterium]